MYAKASFHDALNWANELQGSPDSVPTRDADPVEAPAIIRSGWWVAVAAVGVSAVVATILIIPIFAGRAADRASQEFNLAKPVVPSVLVEHIRRLVTTPRE